MQCPACQNILKTVAISGVELDVCEGGCGGIWFDQFELSKFDEPHEVAGEELLKIQRNYHASLDERNKLSCSKCLDVVMMRHFFSVKRSVEIDECPGCGGLWLDFGELEQIRKLFNDEKDRHSAFQEYFDETFGKKIEEIQLSSSEKFHRARRFANLFRFICLSYYIPEKQSWGAF